MKNKIENRIFNLRPKCKVVYGAKRAAIYNLKNGNVYSLNEEGSKIIRIFCNKEINFNNKIALDYLLKLQKLGLGNFSKYRVQRKNGEEIDVISKPNLNFLWLELTSRCNLHCIHCYVNNNNTIEQQLLSTEDWKKIISEARLLGCESLQFIGGEPFLRKDIFNLIKFAKRKKYSSIGVFTNAVLLDKEKIKLLSDLNIYLKVSLYSYDPIVHDRITQVKGSFLKTLEAVRLITKYKVKIQIAIIIMKHNQYSLKGLRRFLKQLNIEYRTPDLIRPTGRGANKLLFPTNRKVKELRILKKPDFVTEKDFFLQSKIWNNCWFGKLAITNLGNVVPCIFARDQIIGNIRHKNLSQILNSNKLCKFWKVTKDKVDVCQDCEYRYACKDCRPLSYYTFGNLYAESPRCTYDPYKGIWRNSA